MPSSRYRVKPPPGTQIDRNHPRTRGLTGAWDFLTNGGSIAYDGMQTYGNGVLTNGPRVKDVQGGRALDMVGASNHSVVIPYNPNHPWTQGSSPARNMFTLGFLVKAPDTSGVAIALCDNALSGSYQFNSFWFDNGWQNDFGGGNIHLASTVPGQWYYMLFSCDDGYSNNAAYLNGVPVNSGNSDIAGQGPSGRTEHMGDLHLGGTTSPFFPTMQVALMRLWNRALNQREVLEEFQNPWDIYKLPRKLYYIVAGAPPQTVGDTPDTGIVSAETFGSGGVVTGPLAGASGIVSAETFGSGGVVSLGIVGATGIPSAEDFPTTGLVGLIVSGSTGIVSEETFGTDGSVIEILTMIGETGIESEEAFGTDGQVTGPVTGATGIASEEDFPSTGDVNQLGLITGLFGQGIASGETFGIGGSVIGPVAGSTGIPSEEAFGVGGLLIFPQTVTGATGIPSEEDFPSGGTLATPIIGVTGIPSAETFGIGGTLTPMIAGIQGIRSEEAFGLGGFVMPPPGPGTMFRTYVGGALMGNIQTNSIRTSRTLNFSGTAQLSAYDGLGNYIPETGEEVVLWYNNAGVWVKWFGGSVDNVTLSKGNNLAREAGKRLWALSCVDYGKALSRRLVNRKFSAADYGTLNSILQALSDAYLAPEGIRVVFGDDSDIIIPDVEFSYIPLNQVLDQLADMANMNWQVDWDRNFSMGLNPCIEPTAPFNIGEMTANGRDFVVTRSRGLYRNRQYIKASLSQTTTTITKSYTVFTAFNPLLGDEYFVNWNGLGLSDQEFDNRVVDILDVQLNAVAIPFIHYQESYTSDDRTNYAIGQSIPRTLNLMWNQYARPTFPVEGDVLTVTFTVNNDLPSQVYVENSAEVATRKAIEGGTGLYEDVYEVTDINDPTLLLGLAQKLLDRFSVMGLEVQYTTFAFGLECGQAQTMDLPKFEINNESLTVESIESIEVDEVTLQHTVKVSNQVQQRDAMTAFKRLIKKLQTSRNANTWPMIFSLGETIHGVGLDNPGVQVGSNVTPEWILTKDVTFVEVQVSFKVPPTGASIIFDILADGSTVMKAPIEYTIAGGVQTYKYFHSAPLTVAKGSKISINVTQVGTSGTGKDGTISILAIAGQ